jgi:hypothetical protein
MKGRINRISEKRYKGYWLVDIDPEVSGLLHAG